MNFAEFMKKHYATMCFAMAILFLMWMIGADNNVVRALTGFLTVLAGSMGLAFMRKLRSNGLEDTKESQPENQLQN